MNRWLWIAGGVLLAVACVSVWYAFQRVDFVGGLVALAAAAVVPAVVGKVTKRMTPEQEAAWHDCERRGGRWNPVKKRCEERLR